MDKGIYAVGLTNEKPLSLSLCLPDQTDCCHSILPHPGLDARDYQDITSGLFTHTKKLNRGRDSPFWCVLISLSFRLLENCLDMGGVGKK